jgi:hypothetical protein
MHTTFLFVEYHYAVVSQIGTYHGDRFALAVSQGPPASNGAVLRTFAQVRGWSCNQCAEGIRGRRHCVRRQAAKYFVDGRILERTFEHGIRAVADKISVDRWKASHFRAQGRACGGW